MVRVSMREYLANQRDGLDLADLLNLGVHPKATPAVPLQLASPNVCLQIQLGGYFSEASHGPQTFHLSSSWTTLRAKSGGSTVGIPRIVFISTTILR